MTEVVNACGDDDGDTCIDDFEFDDDDDDGDDSAGGNNNYAYANDNRSNGEDIDVAYAGI